MEFWVLSRETRGKFLSVTCGQMMLTFTIFIIPCQLLNLLVKTTVDVQIKYHFFRLGQDARHDRVPVLTGLTDDTLQDVPGPGQGEDG